MGDIPGGENVTVQELIDALSKATRKDAPVDIIDTAGNYLAESDELFQVDEDADGETVHVVCGFPKL